MMRMLLPQQGHGCSGAFGGAGQAAACSRARRRRTRTHAARVGIFGCRRLNSSTRRASSSSNPTRTNNFPISLCVTFAIITSTSIPRRQAAQPNGGRCLAMPGERNVSVSMSCVPQRGSTFGWWARRRPRDALFAQVVRCNECWRVVPSRRGPRIIEQGIAAAQNAI